MQAKQNKIKNQLKIFQVKILLFGNRNSDTKNLFPLDLNKNLIFSIEFTNHTKYGRKDNCTSSNLFEVLKLFA